MNRFARLLLPMFASVLLLAIAAHAQAESFRRTTVGAIASGGVPAQRGNPTLSMYVDYMVPQL